jgi:hypothetical protein
VVYPEKGIAALVATLSAAPAAHRAQRVASPFDWPKLMAGATHIFPLFSEHAQHATAPTAGAVSTAAAGSGSAAGPAVPGGRWGGRAAHQQQQPQRKQDVAELQAAVAEVVAGVLGAAVEPMQPLMEAGPDSIGVHPPCSADIWQQGCSGKVRRRTARPPAELEGQSICSGAQLGCTALTLSDRLQHAQARNGICTRGAGAVELRTSLGTRFGTELPATATFDYPTVATLAGFLAGAESINSTPINHGRSAVQGRAAAYGLQTSLFVHCRTHSAAHSRGHAR